MQNLIENVYAFFIKMLNNIFKKNIPKEEDEEEIQSLAENIDIESFEQKKENSKVKVTQMMLTRLYMLKQKIIIFQKSFPEKYQFFEGKIEKLEADYNQSLEELKKDLSFEIDPEKDGEKYARVIMIERDVQTFLEKEVKFDYFIKRLETLIVKLNILYNVSVIHNQNEEREKAILQTKRAINVQEKIIQEFRNCEYLLMDMRLKNKIAELISYLDYQIFKLMVRNSDILPSEALKNMAILVEFEGFNYKAAFEVYIEEELTEIYNSMDMIQDEVVCKTLKKECESIIFELAYSKNDLNCLENSEFWESIFEIESMTISILKESGINNAKIKIISRVNISVSENDVLISPKVNTFLALTNIFTKTKDSKITLVIKLLKNISDDISYKEIYFLLVLFDILDIVKTVPNEIKDDLEKYLEKYPYSDNEMEKKKEKVWLLDDKEYVYCFSIEDYEQNLIKELEKLNMDFKNVDNKIFLNKIYFSGLTTVINSLVTYLNN